MKVRIPTVLRLSFLGSQLRANEKNKSSGSRRKICQERIKESLWDQGSRLSPSPSSLCSFLASVLSLAPPLSGEARPLLALVSQRPGKYHGTVNYLSAQKFVEMLHRYQVTKTKEIVFWPLRNLVPRVLSLPERGCELRCTKPRGHVWAVWMRGDAAGGGGGAGSPSHDTACQSSGEFSQM